MNYVVMALLNIFINVNLKDISNEKYFSAQDRVVSTASKRSFDFVTQLGPVYLDCHLTSFAYVISFSTLEDK